MENLKNIAPLADFDWNAFENGTVESAQSHEETEKAYDATLGRVNENEVVEGTVISIGKREVVVNIGYKSDGIIPVRWKSGRQAWPTRALTQEGSCKQVLGTR